jgi:hypothetical protein
MDEPKMGFFPKIYYSIAGFGSYRYFIKQRPGKAVVYLLLLTLILGIVSLVPIVSDYNNVINGFINSFDTKVPEFTLKNGELNVEGKMPIIINDGGSTTIIDTSGKTDESILDNYDNVILITRDKMIQKTFANQRVTSFSALQGFTMNKENVKRLLPLLKWGTVLIIIFGTIFFICGKFISALLISLIGLIINSSKKAKLTYKAVFQISAYSLTLPLFVGTLLNLIPFNVPYLWLIFYLLSSVYVWGAINSIKRDIDIPLLPPEE